MRNLKRALSLALASVMVVSMMVVGAGAASYDEFTDKDEIVNKEAVQMLVELGVINGKDTGDFDPTGIVTRAEMAKMICVVLNGGKDPSLGTTVTNTYTDTVGHWASGYIEYCTQLGIVAGDGTGKFNPNATVTGSEAAKMLLVALGYKSEVEGFTGANWALAVNTRGSQKGLYNDLDIVVDQGLTRDNAAQMIYNALDANMVEYSYTLVTDGSSLSSSPTLKDKVNNDGYTVTLLEDRFNAVKVEGVVISNEVANLNTSGASDAGKTVIAVTNDDDQSTYSGNETFSISTGMEDLGRSVVLYAKKESNSSKAEIYGSAITSDDNKVVVDYSSDPIADVADDNDLDETTAKVAVNYGSAVSYKDYKENAVAGVEKILIDNDDDGDLDYVLVNTYTFGKVTSYVTSGDGSITVRAGSGNTFSKSDKDDVVGFDDVAKNDYVTAIEIGGKLHVAKAETVTGVMEAYKTNSKGTVVTKLTVDGTDYNVSNVPGYTDGTDAIRAAASTDSVNLDTEATFYLTAGGYIAALGDVAENAYNYALVLATGTTGLEDRVRVALSDGTVATYDYTSNSDDPVIGNVYSYSINSKDQIRLTAVASDNTKSGYDTKLTFEKGKTSIQAEDKTTLYANSNTAFFYVGLTALDDETPIDSDVVDTYTGYANAPTLDTGVKAVVYTRGDKDSTRAAAVVFYGEDLTTGDVSDTLFITSKGSTTSDYINATAFLPGSTEAQSIKVDKDSDAVVSDKAYTYTISSDGYYVLDDDKFDSDNCITSGTVSTANSDTFVVGNKEFVITSDTLFVDNSDYLDDAVAELGAGPDEDDTIAYVIFNKDDEAILVVIENKKSGESDFNTDPDIGDVTVSGKTIEVPFTGDVPETASVRTAIINAIKSSDSSIDKVSLKNLDLEKGTVTVTGTYTSGDEFEDTYTVKFYNETIDTAAESVQEIDGYEFKSEISVVGNTVTMKQESESEIRDVYMNDVARFLGQLHEAGISEIKFNGITYKWADPATLQGSNWTVNGAPVVSEPVSSRNTLVYAIFGSSSDDTAKNPTSITLTVDGVEMIINLVK